MNAFCIDIKVRTPCPFRDYGGLKGGCMRWCANCINDAEITEGAVIGPSIGYRTR